MFIIWSEDFSSHVYTDTQLPAVNESDCNILVHYNELLLYMYNTDPVDRAIHIDLSGDTYWDIFKTIKYTITCCYTEHTNSKI